MELPAKHLGEEGRLWEFSEGFWGGLVASHLPIVNKEGRQ